MVWCLQQLLHPIWPHCSVLDGRAFGGGGAGRPPELSLDGQEWWRTVRGFVVSGWGLWLVQSAFAFSSVQLEVAELLINRTLFNGWDQ